MSLGNSIEQVNSDRLLGLIIDGKLNCEERIDELSRKLAQRLGVLAKKNLLIKERKLCYNSMIKRIMLYGSIVWDSCSSENIDKIYKLQERAARVIL